MSPKVCKNPGKYISIKVGIASTISGTLGGGPLVILEATSAPT